MSSRSVMMAIRFASCHDCDMAVRISRGGGSASGSRFGGILQSKSLK